MKMTHIPYKADADVIREVMAGTCTWHHDHPEHGAGHQGGQDPRDRRDHREAPALPARRARAGKTGVKSLAALEPHTFISLVGPAGMPAPVVAKLNDAINKVSAMPDVSTRVRESLYAEPATMSPAAFREFTERQLAIWRELGKTVKLPD
jgi:hypothetical protein